MEGVEGALPHLNAALNLSAGVLLVLGYRAVRRREIPRHKRCMLSAFTCSAVFLVSYVLHKVLAGGTTVFPAEGAVRTVYLTILISHSILAAVTVPLAVTTITLGLRDRVSAHRRVARVTLPIWLYVSVTGVVVYWMLYRMEWG
jgi:uncharacterized membrane protein YozB (DUF420 family)